MIKKNVNMVPAFLKEKKFAVLYIILCVHWVIFFSIRKDRLFRF